jgi:hypothetical protein
MGTTTNNGWTYPESTDLVKDGATAIQTLADDIDTTLGVYAPSTSGLTLINTTSFSAVASQSLPNDTFTSAYDRYILHINLTSVTSTDAFLTVKLRAAGTTTTGSDYFYAGTSTNQDSTTSNNGNANTNLGHFPGFISSLADFEPTFATITIANPFLSVRTAFTSHMAGSTAVAGVGKFIQTVSGGFHNLANSYDSLTLVPSAGNVSGSMTVFGVNK